MECWQTPPAEAFAWVIFVQIWAFAGITMMIFISGLQTIPSDMYEAARIDGASSWQVFANVTWPLLTPSVNTNIILNIIGSLQAWQLFLVLLGYRNGTQVLGYLIFAQGFGQTSGSVTSGPCASRSSRLARKASASLSIRASSSRAATAPRSRSECGQAQRSMRQGSSGVPSLSLGQRRTLPGRTSTRT